ncbi:MAG: fumarylacetoacetate hydrolase family protein [Beijerinckiaceae bacterium]
MNHDATAVTNYVFPPMERPVVPIVGSDKLFPVHRIFCVGRNYAEHAKEMGVEVDREAPFYFMKPATAIAVAPATTAYPPGTNNFHYEMELVVALGGPAFKIAAAKAGDVIFGYACGLDMTRRDLQQDARAKGRPWDTGKAVEQSAVISPIARKETFAGIGDQTITLALNGATKQSARLSDLVWSVPEILAHLSTLYHLGPGDLIYTGTPAGVGPVAPGDHLIGRIDGLPDVELTIGPREET